MRPVRLLALAPLLIILVSCLNRPAENRNTTSSSDSVYLKLGDQLVAKTFDTLRNALTTAIGSKGFAYAVAFCDENAYPLTTYYQEAGISIRRASDKPRNPQNKADSLETALLNEFRASRGTARIVHTTTEVHYVKHILVQGMCLNCHGLPGKEIKPETLAAINERYAADSATGYKEGALRGLWHVVFKKSGVH